MLLQITFVKLPVVLLAEDVDRNYTALQRSSEPPVVLLAEDVDRNASQ